MLRMKVMNHFTCFSCSQNKGRRFSPLRWVTSFSSSYFYPVNVRNQRRLSLLAHGFSRMCVWVHTHMEISPIPFSVPYVDHISECSLSFGPILQTNWPGIGWSHDPPLSPQKWHHEIWANKTNFHNFICLGQVVDGPTQCCILLACRTVP
jgi:hypothetical protein